MINKIRALVKDNNPLIHCITNPISINQCANTVLSVGARPIMAEHPKEVSEITKTTDALMLNIGNITDVRMESITISAKTAVENNIPFVFDVVGVACSEMRRKFATDLIEKYPPSIVKGNYSEIKALCSYDYKSAGVDSDGELNIESISKEALNLAQKYNCIVLASGKTDIVTDGQRLVYVKNGTSQLARITGTGCMLGALCAVYLSANKDIHSAITACVVLGICGELSRTEKGNGTFMVNLMDILSTLTDNDINKYIKTEDVKIEEL
ncbi:MAG: hydroxyethylthiazole kinase [Clostridia bacterium]|nr:hydroxyethylthiazole kinase [Clostridia bacterium]